MSTDLSLHTLRAANLARLPQFRNAQGEPAHSQPDGSDWSLNDWCTALTGEVGEMANILKKIRRGDLSLENAQMALESEMADILTYLDLLAARCGVDLAEATARKFNNKSIDVGSTIRLHRAHGRCIVADLATARTVYQERRERITALETDSEHYADWNQETGQPGVMTFANAIQVWSVAQGRPATVQEAAVAFNVRPELVREAVAEHPWMFVGADDTIQHDGE